MIILDVREEDEIAEYYVNPVNDNLQMLYIPSRMIFANVPYLKKVARTEKIWIMCKSGRRAQKVKDKYFADVDSIKVIKGGIIGIEEEEGVEREFYEIVKNGRKYSPQQVMQFVFAFMLIVLVFIYWFYNRYFLIAAGVIIGIVLVQAFTKFCLLGMIIPWRLAH